jgi:1-acyl-sn-glycerol-3-phosphate acyltransferase
MLSTPKFITETLHTLYGLYFCGVFVVCSTCTAIMVSVIPGQSRRRRLARGMAQLVFRLTATWPSLQGLENLPPESAVVVANHASYLDGVLLTAVLPHRYQFVIKREVSELPLANYLLRRIGAQFVDRDDPHRGGMDTRRILQIAETGASLAFFPEGTFRPEPGLRRFHKGAFTIAVRNNLALIPVSIQGTRKMLPEDRLLPRLARLSVTIIPQQPTRNGHTDVSDLQAHCRKLILEQLDEPDHLNR